MRSRKLNRLIAAGSLICFAGAISAGAKGSDDRAIKALLSEQGFSGELSGDVAFVKLGNMDCNRRALRVVYYEWTETKSPGAAIHASQRLVFLDAKRYVGSYSVDDRPATVGQEQIVFAYPKKMGNSLRCGSDGLPKTVLLNGYLQPLFK